VPAVSAPLSSFVVVECPLRSDSAIVWLLSAALPYGCSWPDGEMTERPVSLLCRGRSRLHSRNRTPELRGSVLVFDIPRTAAFACSVCKSGRSFLCPAKCGYSAGASNFLVSRRSQRCRRPSRRLPGGDVIGSGRRFTIGGSIGCLYDNYHRVLEISDRHSIADP
jgi:hypothetical protein